MTKENIDQYKLKLEEERRTILNEIKQNETVVDFGNNIDTEDDSDQVEELGNQLAVAHDLKKRLDDVESAIAKIKTGTYGTCEKCNGEISSDILDIDPESRFCKNCKTNI